MPTDKAVEALKECPFCNGRAQLIELDKDLWRVACVSDAGWCGCEQHNETAQQVITAWNTRATLPARQDQGVAVSTGAENAQSSEKPDYWEDRALAAQNDRIIKESGFMAFTFHQHGELYPAIAFKDNETRAKHIAAATSAQQKEKK